MKILEMTGPKTSRIIDVPDLEPSSGQVLVRVKYTGLCMSEWYPWLNARPGDRMGHEPVGTVAALGEGVSGFQVGDRVTGLASSSTYAEYCLFDQKNLVHIPDNISDEDALGEPLSCLVSVASKLKIEKAGDTVAVVGTGYMGLGMISLLKLQGAGTIIGVDPRPIALENALKFGATEVYAPQDVPKKYMVTEWDDDMLIKGVPVVSEFSGTQDGLRLAGDMTAVHGTLGVGGWHQGGMRSVDFRLWGWKGIVVNNTHERRVAFQVECCKNALDMLSRDIWNFKGVGNRIYGLDEFDRANEEFITKPDNIIKPLIKCSDW